MHLGEMSSTGSGVYKTDFVQAGGITADLPWIPPYMLSKLYALKKVLAEEMLWNVSTGPKNTQDRPCATE